jgi:hypothetical protein
MADFQIKIRTTAEGTGAQQTAADLDKLKTGATGATQPIGKLTEETDKAGISKGKLSIAIQKLSHDIPFLGTLAAAVKHPIIGIAAAVGLVIREILKQIEVQDQLAVQGAALSAALDPVVIKTFTHKTEAAAAAIAAQAHADAMGNAAREANNLDAALSKSLGAIDRDLRVKQAALQVEKQAALKGVTDPGQRARIELQFEEKARVATFNAERQKALEIGKAEVKAGEDAINARLALPEERAHLARMEAESKQSQIDREAMAGPAKLSALQQELAKAEAGPSMKEIMGRFLRDVGLGPLAPLGEALDAEQRTPEEIRTEIDLVKRAQDDFTAKAKREQAAIQRQTGKVKGLETTEAGAERFAPRIETAIADLGANRTILALQTQLARLTEETRQLLEIQTLQEKLNQALKKFGEAVISGTIANTQEIDELTAKLQALQGR